MLYSEKWAHKHARGDREDTRTDMEKRYDAAIAEFEDELEAFFRKKVEDLANENDLLAQNDHGDMTPMLGFFEECAAGAVFIVADVIHDYMHTKKETMSLSSMLKKQLSMVRDYNLQMIEARTRRG